MLAIVIPYYKRSFFEDTLQSLDNQTDKRFKVYVGDDASLESPTDLLAKYQGTCCIMYHRFEKNVGLKSLVLQWERCIGLINNEDWLMILGDDDVLSPTGIEEFYNCLPEIEEEKCSVVRFASLEIDESNNKTTSLYTHPKLEKATDFFYRRFTNKTRSSLSEYVFKRSAYKKYGFYHYDLAWFTDDRAWLEFSEFNNIYSINSALVSFRLSRENISRSNYKQLEKEKMRFQFIKYIVSKHLNKFKRHQQKHFLLYYEQLIYKNKKANFYFWFLVFSSFLKRFYFIQGIKFTRRVVIYLRSNE